MYDVALNLFEISRTKIKTILIYARQKMFWKDAFLSYRETRFFIEDIDKYRGCAVSYIWKTSIP